MKTQHSVNVLLPQDLAERNTKIVTLLAAVTMVVEIVGGTIFGSMALLADGWHMATHIAAFAIAIFAYQYARKNANNPKYTFGTGKVSVLGGFASAVGLAVVAFIMILESIARLFEPHPFHFYEAITIAAIGLTVNLISALLLQNNAGGSCCHHHHHHHQQDYNLRAAYIHVLADALTSILAIFALFARQFFALTWIRSFDGFSRCCGYYEMV